MAVQYGLTTEKAMKKFHDNIQEELNCFVKTKQRDGWTSHLRDMLTSRYIPFTTFGMVFLLIETALLLAAVVVISKDESAIRMSSVCLELAVVAFFSCMLVLICLREFNLKENEMQRLIIAFLNAITYDKKNPWTHEHYPDLTLPETNSISLVWTYRDGEIVNLPHNLLVEGDVIILGPSRVAPAECRQIFTKARSCPKSPTLETGDVFNPSLDNDGNALYQPYPRQMFEVLQAPARAIIKTYLKSCELRRCTMLNASINIIMQVFEGRIIWIILGVSLILNIFRWQFFHNDVGDYSEMLFLMQAYTILPLLPLVYPVLWVAVTLYGTARLRILFAMYTKRRSEATESEDISLEHVNCPRVLWSFWYMVLGHPQGLPRTVNLLHTLSSITTSCCVDKEGILCYTNPVPEKIFFFKDRGKMKQTHEIENLLDDNCEFYVKDDSVIVAAGEATQAQNNSNAVGEATQVESTSNAGVGFCGTRSSSAASAGVESVAAAGPNNDIEVLNISTDPKSQYGIQFDDVDWEDQLPSLKPLGMNMLFNSPCQYPIKSLRTEDFMRHLSLTGNHTVVQNFRGCLCAMAKQIGFQDRILNMFKNHQQVMSFRPLNKSEEKPSDFFLSVLKEKHVPVMMATTINDGKHAISQLLAQGSADLILDACTDVWNGEEISALTEVERKKALSFFQRMSITRKCIAFSYRPVFRDEHHLDDIFFEFPAPSKKSNCERQSAKNIALCAKRTHSDIQCEDMMQHTSLLTHNVDRHIKNLHRQIFLGMVTLTHSLKEDVVLMVEQLNNAGVRFVHFSYDNELLSRVFCQRLGLETGWNCHISLGESYGTTTNVDDDSSLVSDTCPLLNEEDNELLEKNAKVHRSNSYPPPPERTDEQDDEYDSGSQSYDNYDELYFMSNRSRLPKGIQNMRSHLEKVDDVPLLVPLFTDCNSDAVSDMISIMQEYGDIVCCTGSVLNANNFKIFSQSDVSIAMEPIFHQTCVWKPAQPEGPKTSDQNCLVHPHTSALENISSKGPLALSASFNSLPCSLLCRRKDDFPIGPLLCEARRIATAAESCFLFLMSCQLSLALLMLLSSAFMLPPPLSGLQLMWLTIVIVPLISISLIGTPADKHIMKTITGKREDINAVKGMIAPYLRQFVPTFLLNTLFIMMCIFPCLLFSFCKQISTEQCNFFLGARNQTAYWNGWYDGYRGGFFFVQDIVLFYITLTFIVLSISFVHRHNLLWQRLPTKNKPWCLCIFVGFLIQLLHTICSLYHWTTERLSLPLFLHNIPYELTLAAMLWLLVLVGISEFLKRKHIKTFKRFQKRERLKFDTKLGMNSPV